MIESLFNYSVETPLGAMLDPNLDCYSYKTLCAMIVSSEVPGVYVGNSRSLSGLFAIPRFMVAKSLGKLKDLGYIEKYGKIENGDDVYLVYVPISRKENQDFLANGEKFETKELEQIMQWVPRKSLKNSKVRAEKRAKKLVENPEESLTRTSRVRTIYSIYNNKERLFIPYNNTSYSYTSFIAVHKRHQGGAGKKGENAKKSQAAKHATPLPSHRGDAENLAKANNSKQNTLLSKKTNGNDNKKIILANGQKTKQAKQKPLLPTGQTKPTKQENTKPLPTKARNPQELKSLFLARKTQGSAVAPKNSEKKTRPAVAQQEKPTKSKVDRRKFKFSLPEKTYNQEEKPTRNTTRVILDYLSRPFAIKHKTEMANKTYRNCNALLKKAFNGTLIEGIKPLTVEDLSKLFDTFEKIAFDDSVQPFAGPYKDTLKKTSLIDFLYNPHKTVPSLMRKFCFSPLKAATKIEPLDQELFEYVQTCYKKALGLNGNTKFSVSDMTAMSQIANEIIRVKKEQKIVQSAKKICELLFEEAKKQRDRGSFVSLHFLKQPSTFYALIPTLAEKNSRSEKHYTEEDIERARRYADKILR